VPQHFEVVVPCADRSSINEELGRPDQCWADSVIGDFDRFTAGIVGGSHAQVRPNGRCELIADDARLIDERCRGDGADQHGGDRKEEV
jgi:hypothetical protein